SGILEYYSNNENERFENISALNRLIDEARSYAMLHKGARLNDFVKHLDTYYVKDIKMELKNNELKTEAVRLLTYHGSKGREFEHVFMPNLTSKAFEKASSGNRELALPVKKSKFTEDKDLNLDAELKRLLFVGITRAKYGLHLSYSNAFNGVSQSATKYISNLFPKADELVENKFFQIDENAKIDETIKDLKVSEFSGDYKKELETRVENLVISQTSLNKYINCPLQYLYSDILKIPVFIEDKDILSYGSSIHGAIEFMTNNAIKKGAWGTKDEMFENFCKETNKFEFSSPERRADFISRGKNSIEKNFYAFTQFSPSNIISAECRMELEFEGCILKGFADRISKDSEGKIHIYDFKTGSYKKIKQDENYYNQLCFYKFLYETLHQDEKIGSCALVFFEEGCRISSPDEICIDNEKIKEKIHNTINGIKSLSFEPEYSKDNCAFCEYKLICKLFKNKARIIQA
ncbi:MAG: PD-(D/E)XK nuclease family protein, partial [Candidatus Gastranaerophilales bacterium]|nr:PD-(D/E)XK nuclease family protein [Candidatus Gastranaerophilales bacterium]